MAIAAFGIIWLFWLGVILLMASWRRSWLPLFAFPVVISLLIGLVALTSELAAFLLALALHLSFFLVLVYVAIAKREQGDDPLFKRPPT